MKLIQRRGLFALSAGLLAAPAVLRAQTAIAPGVRNIADTMAGDPRFSRFLDIITRASAVEMFRVPGPLTVFAPVDTAWNSVPAGIMQDLLNTSQQGSANRGDIERQRILPLINYHIVNGAYPAASLMGQNRSVSTANGAAIRIDSNGSEMTLVNPAPAAQLGSFGAAGAQVQARPARVVQPNIPASNGIIHAIDQVLWP